MPKFWRKIYFRLTNYIQTGTFGVLSGCDNLYATKMFCTLQATTGSIMLIIATDIISKLCIGPPAPCCTEHYVNYVSSMRLFRKFHSILCNVQQLRQRLWKKAQNLGREPVSRKMYLEILTLICKMVITAAATSLAVNEDKLCANTVLVKTKFFEIILFYHDFKFAPNIVCSLILFVLD